MKQEFKCIECDFIFPTHPVGDPETRSGAVRLFKHLIDEHGIDSDDAYWITEDMIYPEETKWPEEIATISQEQAELLEHEAQEQLSD